MDRDLVFAMFLSALLHPVRFSTSYLTSSSSSKMKSEAESFPPPPSLFQVVAAFWIAAFVRSFVAVSVVALVFSCPAFSVFIAASPLCTTPAILVGFVLVIEQPAIEERVGLLSSLPSSPMSRHHEGDLFLSCCCYCCCICSWLYICYYLLPRACL